MTINSMNEKLNTFNEVFGESLEHNDYYLALSATRYLGLVESNKFDIEFETYNQLDIPKEDEKRNEIIQIGDAYFDFKIIRKIINAFFGKSSMDMFVMKHEKGHALFIDLKDCLLVLADKFDEKKMTVEKYEVIYECEKIFSNTIMGDDMEL